MADELLVQIASIKRLLGSLQSNPEAFAACSRNQRDAVCTALQRTGYDTDNASKIVDAVMGVGFATIDGHQLLQEIQQDVKSVASSNTRVDLQDYRTIGNFGTETFWSNLNNLAIALSSLTRFAHDLGLRNGSEPSFQSMTCLLLMATEGYEKARSMSPAMLHESFQSVKRSFKTLPNMHQPVRIADLPETPCELKKNMVFFGRLITTTSRRFNALSLRGTSNGSPS